MNDLRLLQQIDPYKKIISLQFKQIASLEPLIPLLSKFEQLETLSLHGNRLKNLPKNLSSLQVLTQLDISNNLFTDLQDVVESLKTIPQLRHLIINFKNSNQENFVKNQLPHLQRLNKKPILSSKAQHLSVSSHQRVKDSYKLSQSQLENVGILYDEIRQVYHQSKYLVDKQLATDFDRNVQNIMSEISLKLKTSKSQTQSNCHVLSGKYALIDLCFVKMITYFYHFDKKIAKILESIHDHQADTFRNITQLLFNQIQRKKTEISQIKLKKQDIYRTQIKRLKNFQEQSHKQMNRLQQQNRQLMKKMYKKAQVNVVEQTIMSRVGVYNHEQTPTKSMKSQRNPYSPINKNSHNKQNSKTVTVRNKPKNLTLNQVKELLYEIYYSKLKNNQACTDSYQPLQTMQMHMYTYLNLKYGLKNIAIEWAMALVNGIRRYGLNDAQIAMFGKILRNQLDQTFVENVKRLRILLLQSTKKFKGIMYEQFSVHSQMTIHQCQQILLYMSIKRPQANQIINRISSKISNNMITYQQFEYGVIDHYLQNHQKRLKKVVTAFKQVDKDQDGIINYDQMQEMLQNLDPKFNPQGILTLVDNSGKGVITFSALTQVMLKNLNDFGHIFDGPKNIDQESQ